MSRKNLYHIVVHLFAIIGVIYIWDYSNTFIFGDTIAATHQRGIVYIHRAWNKRPITPEVGFQIQISNLNVNVVGSYDHLRDEWERYYEPRENIVGFTRVFRPKTGILTNMRTEIWVVGKRDRQGRIYINQETLGHELQHVVRAYNPSIVDPDGSHH